MQYQFHSTELDSIIAHMKAIGDIIKSASKRNEYEKREIKKVCYSYCKECNVQYEGTHDCIKYRQSLIDNR